MHAHPSIHSCVCCVHVCLRSWAIQAVANYNSTQEYLQSFYCAEKSVLLQYTHSHGATCNHLDVFGAWDLLFTAISCSCVNCLCTPRDWSKDQRIGCVWAQTLHCRSTPMEHLVSQAAAGVSLAPGYRLLVFPTHRQSINFNRTASVRVAAVITTHATLNRQRHATCLVCSLAVP